MATPLKPILQSAPEWRGAATYGAGSWGGAAISVLGWYTGAESKTYTITAEDSGTIDTTATIRLTYSDGVDDEGVLNVGTDSYVGGDPVPFPHGLSLSFAAAGTVTAAQAFTIAVVAARAIRDDHLAIASDLNPAWVDVPMGDLADKDSYWETDDNTIMRERRAILRKPRFSILPVDSGVRSTFDRMVHHGHRLTFGEVYSRGTVLSWRGGGLQPIVGPRLAFTRSGAGVAIDRFSSKLKFYPDSNSLRVVPGPHGPAAVMSRAMSNFLPTWLSTAASAAWSALAGSPTITFDTTRKPPLDRSVDGFSRAQMDGMTRVVTASTVDVVQSGATGALTAGVRYSMRVFLAGRGLLSVSLWGATSGIFSTTFANVSEDGAFFDVSWLAPAAEACRVLVSPSAATPSSVFWIGPVAITQSWSAEDAMVPTSGGGASRSDESCSAAVAVPPSSGTAILIFRIPVVQASIPSSSFITLLEGSGVSGSERFSLRLSFSGPRFEFHTSTSGWLSSAAITVPYGVWACVAATWGGIPFTRSVYYTPVGGPNVSLLSSDTAAAALSFGTGLSILPAAGINANGVQIAQLLVERGVMPLEDIQAVWDRYVDGAWRQLFSSFAGREFFVGQYQEARWSESVPGIWTIGGELVEAGYLEDALVMPR